MVILTPRFTEHPLTPREYADLERSASWVGRTIASMQVWDILRTVDWIAAEEKIPASSLTVAGKDGMGILALYAGLRDPRIGRIVLQNPPSSHVDGPALLNILRITDIPEVARTFGTKKLTVIGIMGQTQGMTRANSPPSAEARRNGTKPCCARWAISLTGALDFGAAAGAVAGGAISLSLGITDESGLEADAGSVALGG